MVFMKIENKKKLLNRTKIGIHYLNQALMIEKYH